MGLALRVLVAAIVGGALLAPGAAAIEHRFVASNGTTCVLDGSHSVTPETAGEWTIEWDTGVACQGAMGRVEVATELWQWMPEGWQIFHYGQDAWCDGSLSSQRPCGAWRVSSYGTVRDRPAGDYEHHGGAMLRLPHAEPGEVQPVWVVTPVELACLPGGQTAYCSTAESFRVE